MTAFLEAMERGDHTAAAEYLDLRFLPWTFTDYEGPELAEMLDFVIERRLWLDAGALSDEPEGELADGLARSRDVLGEIELEGAKNTLYLQRVLSEEGLPVWKVSSVTVAQIADLYRELEYPEAVQWFQARVPEGSFLGLEYFKWAILLGAMALSFPLAYLLGLMLTLMLTRRHSPLRASVRRFFTRSVAFLLILLVGRYVLLELGLGVRAQRITRAHTVIIIAVTWVLLSFVTLVREVVAVRMERQGREAATALLRPFGSMIKFVFIISALILWLDNVGYDVTTLMAGLGIGGLAIALALQKPMEDFFGAITLFTQQPVRLHDFCQFGAVTGTVEEIGLRSSRIRTLDNTVVTVPNARVANEYIENYTKRNSIRYRTEVRPAYGATAAQLRDVLTKIREAVEGHEMSIDEQSRVRLVELDKIGFVIEAIAYINTTNYAEFLGVAEELNLRITEIVQEGGLRFASAQALVE